MKKLLDWISQNLAILFFILFASFLMAFLSYNSIRDGKNQDAIKESVRELRKIQTELLEKTGRINQDNQEFLKGFSSENSRLIEEDHKKMDKKLQLLGDDLGWLEKEVRALTRAVEFRERREK